MVEIMDTHVHKCKNDTYETAPGTRRGRNEREQWMR
jgi:hypothetical protein